MADGKCDECQGERGFHQLTCSKRNAENNQQPPTAPDAQPPTAPDAPKPVNFTPAQQDAIRKIGSILTEHFESSVLIVNTMLEDRWEVTEPFHHGGYAAAFGMLDLARVRLLSRQIAVFSKGQEPQSD